MGSSSGTSEITESKEESDSVHHSKGAIPLSFKLRMNERAQKHLSRMPEHTSADDDINEFIKAIDIKTSRGLGSSRQAGASSLGKRSQKRPIRVGLSQTSGIGISESVSLKQALRGLCISQASEMAAMKRLSKLAGLSGVSEAGTIKRLYRAVVVESGKTRVSPDEDKQSLVEISFVTEKSTLDLSDNADESAGSSQVSKVESSNERASSPPPPVILTEPRVIKVKIATPSPVQNSPESSQVSRDESSNSSVFSSPHCRAPTALRATKVKASTIGPTENGDEPAVSKVESPNPSVFSSPRSLLSTSPRLAKAKISNPSPTCNANKSAESSQVSKAKSLNPSATPPHTMAPTASRVTKGKTSSQDFSLPDSSDGACKISTPDIGMKGNQECASSSNNGLKGNSSSGSPRKMKLNNRKKTNSKKKVKDEVSSNGGSSNTSVQINTVLNSHNSSTSGCHPNKCASKSLKKDSVALVSVNRNLNVEANSCRQDSNCNGCIVDKHSREKKNNGSRSKDKGECSQSSKSGSIGEYSSSTTSISEESNLSVSSIGNRPHMSKDSRWEAIRHFEMQHGSLGLRHFKLLKRLGCGDIGTVYLAELIGTECLFALKVMDNDFLARRKKMVRAQTEREILQMLDHPFLPTLYSHFTTDRLSCLVMEYCPGGDLHVLRQRQPGKSFSEQTARFYAAEVLLALEYLHMLGVVYRDLKPENILVREDGHIMLSDFDLSLRCAANPMLLKSSLPGGENTKRLSGTCTESSCINPFCLEPSWVHMSCFSPRLISPATRSRKPKHDQASHVNPLPQLVVEPTSARSNSFVGTHEYLAPEIIKGEGHGSAVDWWTFGIFLYELLFGRTPFKGSGNEDTLANVVSQSLKFPEEPVGFAGRDLIRGLLIKEPENRLGSMTGATQIKQHPFFEGLNWALIRCALPPESPKVGEMGIPGGLCKRRETKCLEFRTSGEQLEFDLF